MPPKGWPSRSSKVDPGLVRRFLRATLKGWTYAVENPTAIGSMVARYKSDADTDLEVAQMASSIPFVNTGEDHIGWMKPEVGGDGEDATGTGCIDQAGGGRAGVLYAIPAGDLWPMRRET